MPYECNFTVRAVGVVGQEDEKKERKPKLRKSKVMGISLLAVLQLFSDPSVGDI